MSSTHYVLITGGNRGIGLSLVDQLSARAHHHIVVACRSSSEELQTLASESTRTISILEGVDVRNPHDLTARLHALGIDSLSVLINNAGVLNRDELDQLDYEKIEFQFAVNTLGPLKVTEACLSLLKSGSKIANITSRMGSIDDNTSGGMYGYRISKAALNIASKSLAVDLAPRGISVAILHPGFVRTGMTSQRGLIDASESARGLIARIDGLNIDNSGTFWHSNGERLSW
jgi:NAD(P)-dependent dehydrogenase (short-subunit alcohol dehydrogenase family)